MSDKAIGAGNQQGRLSGVCRGEPSETIRQTPFTKLEIIAYLQGAMHDASLNKGKRIRFAQKNAQWLENIQQLLKRIGSNAWIYKEGKDRNVFVLETLCTDLNFAFDPCCLNTNQEKIFYVRGFFDAEGGIPLNNGRFYIQLVQKNFEKIAYLKHFLESMGITCGKIHNPSKRIDPDYWRIFIRAKDHEKFAKTIGSYHPVKAEIFRARMKI